MKIKFIIFSFICFKLIFLNASDIDINKIYITDIYGNGYNIIKSPYTGKMWLDRNLGASRVCQNNNDSFCYGDFYQWGASKKGWIKNYNSNSNLWQAKTNINNPCPKGFRVPSIDELIAETTMQGVENSIDAYNNFLKLITAGELDYNDGSNYDKSSWSFLWSSTVMDEKSFVIGFGSGATYKYPNNRRYGFSVRCIKN